MVIGYDDKGLPKTKNVLAKTKSECVEKLKTLKDALAPPAPPRINADMPFGDAMFIGDVMPSKAENGEKPEK